MLERIPLRTAGFAGTTAQHTVRAVTGLVTGRPAARRPRRWTRRLVGSAGGAVLAVAVTGASRVGRADHDGSSRSPGGRSELGRKTRDELYELARKADIKGRSKMTRKELERALAS